MTRIPPLLVPALFVLALLVQALEGTACAHKRAPSRAEESPPATPAAASSTGRSDFTFLADPSMSPPKVTEDQELVPPGPLGRLVPAIYPAAALAAGAAPARVGLRIVIGDDGFVADVQDSPIAHSTSSPFAAEFRKAAEIAVKRWRFTPGQIIQYEDGQDVDDDGAPDSRSLVRSDRIRVFYDVRFDFEIVAGEGRVRSSADPR